MARRPESPLRTWLGCLAVLWIAAGCAGLLVPSADKDQETGAIVLTDTLNMPVSMKMIPGGRPALFYVCDPAEVTCREGAVYFDTQAGRIKRRGVQPVCVFVSSLEVAGQEAARMGLGVPVYADVSRAIPSRLIGQEIMPALVLLDGKGNVSRVLVGGGETLDTHISTMLEGGRRWYWTELAIAASLVALGVILAAAQ